MQDSLASPDPTIRRRDLESPLLPPHTPMAAVIEKGKIARARLHSKLWTLGVFVRILTLCNAFALMGAAGYSAYLSDPTTARHGETLEGQIRACVELALMFLASIFLLALEWTASTNEAAARSAIGLAFSSGGRLLLMWTLALMSVPAVHSDRSPLELYATGGAVGFLVLSSFLQAWLISCAPEFVSTTVVELEGSKLRLDTTNAFPSIYQRDVGDHLHLGVLLPGFATRPSSLQLVADRLCLSGEIDTLDAPSSAVDSTNSTAGPFGPFHRSIQLAHPVDVTVPTEMRMGLGILEIKFAKGFA